VYFSTAQLLSWKRAAGQNHPQSQPRLSCFPKSAQGSQSELVQVSLELMKGRGTKRTDKLRSGKVPVGVLHFRYRERRRTLRVTLTLPVIAHGVNDQGEKFCVRCATRSINKQGAQLVMDEPLVAGQDLLLVNENTNRSTESRVVYAKKERDGHFYVGVEFVNAENNFWKMTFPLPGARPLRRPLGSKAMA
jgi:hypothetical protein